MLSATWVTYYLEMYSTSGSESRINIFLNRSATNIGRACVVLTVMIPRKRLFLLFALTFSMASGIFQDVIAQKKKNEWKLAKEGGGIEVYTMRDDGARVKRFRVVAQMNYEPALIAGILSDVERYTKWQEDCTEAKVVKRDGANIVVGRYVSSTPFPFSDRDVVIRSTQKTDPDGTIIFKLESTPELYPENKKMVRIRDAGGHWLLTPRPDGFTDVEYEFFADPGGNLPGWLVNAFIVQGPHKTMKNLRALLAEEG